MSTVILPESSAAFDTKANDASIRGEQSGASRIAEYLEEACVCCSIAVEEAWQLTHRAMQEKTLASAVRKKERELITTTLELNNFNVPKDIFLTVDKSYDSKEKKWTECLQQIQLRMMGVISMLPNITSNAAALCIKTCGGTSLNSFATEGTPLDPSEVELLPKEALDGDNSSLFPDGKRVQNEKCPRCHVWFPSQYLKRRLDEAKKQYDLRMGLNADGSKADPTTISEEQEMTEISVAELKRMVDIIEDYRLLRHQSMERHVEVRDLKVELMTRDSTIRQRDELLLQQRNLMMAAQQEASIATANTMRFQQERDRLHTEIEELQSQLSRLRQQNRDLKHLSGTAIEVPPLANTSASSITIDELYARRGGTQGQQSASPPTEGSGVRNDVAAAAAHRAAAVTGSQPRATEPSASPFSVRNPLERLTDSEWEDTGAEAGDELGLFSSKWQQRRAEARSASTAYDAFGETQVEKRRHNHSSSSSAVRSDSEASLSSSSTAMQRLRGYNSPASSDGLHHRSSTILIGNRGKSHTHRRNEEQKSTAVQDTAVVDDDQPLLPTMMGYSPPPVPAESPRPASSATKKTGKHAPPSEVTLRNTWSDV